MQEKVTYHQQPSFCGKPRCRKCRDGIGHGPYWYAYTTSAGQTRRTYIGKELPAEAQLASHAQKAAVSSPDAAKSAFPAPSRLPSLQAADAHIAQGAWPDAIAVLDRLLALDAANEAAAYRLIALLAGQKRRGEALRVYQRCVEALQRLRGSLPSQELQALYEAVRRGETIAYSVSELLATHHTVVALDYALSEERPVTAARADASPVQIGRTHQNPLIGREEEVQALSNLLFDVERYAHRSADERRRRAQALPFDTQRQPQCALLVGDAGIGKTRLAEEVSREAQQRGWSVLWSRIYLQESGIPYRPWVELVRNALQQVGGDWMREGRATGKGTVMGRSGPTLPAYMQPLATLLPELQALVPSRELTTLSAELEQLRLREAIRDVFIATSEVTPLLIVLDDIQWADSSSCELLGYLARHLHGYPLLLLGTCRQYEIAEYPLRSLIDHMQREHTVFTLHVEPLTNEQIALLVSHLPGLPESLVQHIQTQVAGNPFFAEELARLMPPAPSTLPRTITAALESRIARLSTTCQHLLMNASVLGSSFEFSTLCAVASARTGATVDEEDTVLDLLDEALQAGVLTEEGIGSRMSYAFWHPLLVTHLYERLSATRRTRLHRRAAEVLQRLYGSQEQEIAATMTHHLVQGAADPAQIVHAAELAGHRAYALLAYPEAERHYRLAVEYMDKIGGQPTREAALPVSLPDAATLVERLAECNAVQGNFEEARSLYERSLQIRSQRPGALSDAHKEAQRRALLWGEIGRLWRYTGDTTHALRCCERGEAVLREAGVVVGPAWARLRYQVSSFYESEGRYEEARSASQEALSLFEASPSHHMPSAVQLPSSAPLTRIERTLEGDPVNLGRTYALLGMLDYNAGHLDDALAHLQIALTLYEQHDRQREVAHVTCNIGHVHLKRGEYEAAHAALRRSRSLAERIGDGPLTSVIFMNLAELEACADNLTQAEDWYRKSLVLAERFNDRQYISLWHAGLAAVLLAEGKLSEAAASVSKALRTGRAMRNTPCIGAALVALGNVRIAQALATPAHRTTTRLRLLKDARRAVERALSFDHLDAETRSQAQKTLVRVVQENNSLPR